MFHSIGFHGLKAGLRQGFVGLELTYPPRPRPGRWHGPHENNLEIMLGLLGSVYFIFLGGDVGSIINHGVLHHTGHLYLSLLKAFGVTRFGHRACKLLCGIVGATATPWPESNVIVGFIDVQSFQKLSQRGMKDHRGSKRVRSSTWVTDSFKVLTAGNSHKAIVFRHLQVLKEHCMARRSTTPAAH